MVKSQLVKDSGVDVVHVKRILDRRETQLIGFSDSLAAPDTAAGEPQSLAAPSLPRP